MESLNYALILLAFIGGLGVAATLMRCEPDNEPGPHEVG